MHSKVNYEAMFPDERFVADVPLRQAQLIMLRLLKVIDHICRENNIEYWLDGGTLLGAVRHKGFIPWDDDIDIAMMRDDFNRFMELVNDYLPDDMYMQTPESDPGYFRLATSYKVRDTKSFFLEGREDGSEPYHLGVWVDIFVYDHLPESKKRRSFNNYITKKILKLKRAKQSVEEGYHGYALYRFAAKLFSMETLNSTLQSFIEESNQKYNRLIGFGYDSSLKRVYEKEKFFPLIEVEFEGASFLAPKDCDYYLKETYGDYMQLPPLEEQKPKHLVEFRPLKDN